MNCRLSLVFPFFNEEGNVRMAVEPLVNLLRSEEIDYELVLVNNGSHDRTGSILQDLAVHEPRLKVVTVMENRGYGNGILHGLQAASGQYVGYLCGDGQIVSADIVRVYQVMLAEGYDLCKVWRKTRQDGSLRKLISFFYNTIFSIVFRPGCRDINCSPKIFKRELLAPLDLWSKDWFLDAEIMIKARHLRLKVGEIPVTFYPRNSGKSNVRLATIGEFVWNLNRFPFSKKWKEWKSSNLGIVR